MTKLFYIYSAVLFVALIAIMVIYSPDYTRRGKPVFVGKTVCIILYEDKNILFHREARVLTQDAVGHLYEVNIPVEMLQDIQTIQVP